MKKVTRGCFVAAGLLILPLLVGCGQVDESPFLSTDPTPKVYEHTFAQRVIKNDFFQGEFINNEVAAIYPRRDALVKDILVDIGDTVVQGQTLAVLFEPGVEGQSTSSIGLKSTMVQAKNNNLSEAVKVKSAKLDALDAKILEMQVLIEETEKNFDAKISQIGDTAYLGEQIMGTEMEIEMRNLEILEANLEQVLQSRDAKIADSELNVFQKGELFKASVGEIFSDVISLMYIGNEELADYNNIDENDLHDLFSAMNSSVRTQLVYEVKGFQFNRSSLDAFEQSESLIRILPLLIRALENTVTGSDISEAERTSALSLANRYATMIVTQKELYDDAVASKKIVESSEQEKITALEHQIVKQKNIIALLESKSRVAITDKSLAIQTLRSQLETLRKSRDLLVASENQTITSLRNDVSVARADLNKEYIASGNYEITSPFAGVISKRSIQIGEMATMGREAFRITGVENSLSKITKKEIKFYVPEGLKNDVVLDKQVTFFSSEYPDQELQGSIYRISPEVDMITRTYTVQAKVDESVHMPNMSSVRVALETQASIFRIPTSSLYNKDDRKIVYYKKENGKLGVRDVTIISDDGEFSLVTGDIDETLQVVTTPIFIK